jgi:multisubunit Na+/H+ antiporter MnhC subunit
MRKPTKTTICIVVGLLALILAVWLAVRAHHRTDQEIWIDREKGISD